MQCINKTSKAIIISAMAIFLLAGYAMAAPDYEVKGQYAAQGYGDASVSQAWDNNTAAANAVTASGSAKAYGPQTGIVTDLNDPYFYENYYDQVYDCSYCDWY